MTVRRVAWRGVAVVVAVAALALGVGCTSGSDDARPAGSSEVPAGSTVAPAGSGPSVSMVAINQLHGLACPDETDWCDAPARLDLLWRALTDAGCPDLVGLTEIGERQQELVPAMLPSLCDGRYELVWDPESQAEPFDQEMILTTLPVLDAGYVELAAFPWSAQWVRVDGPFGPVDFTVTHFASSANNPPCTPEVCPPVCEAGVEVGTCHAVELVGFLDGLDGAALQVLSGDLNKPIDHPRLAPILAAGYLDSFALAGLPECDPATGEGCTCCIGSAAEPWDGGGLSDPAGRRDGRIDFVFVRGSARCEPEVVPGATAVFAGSAASPPVRGVLWPSDHAGVITAVRCAG